MPQLMTDWHAKEQRIEAALRKVREKQDALRKQADRLVYELETIRAAMQTEDAARIRTDMANARAVR